MLSREETKTRELAHQCGCTCNGWTWDHKHSVVSGSQDDIFQFVDYCKAYGLRVSRVFAWGPQQYCAHVE